MRAPCVLLPILCPPHPQCLNLSCPGLSPDCLCTTTAPTGKGCRPLSLALLQEVGVASLFGTNWVVKRSCTSMHPLRPQENHPGHVNRGAMPLETYTAYIGFDFPDFVAEEIESPVTQPVLSPVLSPVHGLLRRCVQGAEIGRMEPVTSIRLKIEESWYASMDCKVHKLGPWVCFYGGHSTGYKLGNHPKNIEPCAHCVRTVHAPCDNAPKA